MKTLRSLTSLAISIATIFSTNSIHSATLSSCTTPEDASNEARAIGEFQEVAMYDGSKGISQDTVAAVEQSVVRLVNVSGSSVTGFCSGTLLPNNLVLTAAHCFTSGTVNPSVHVEFNYQQKTDGTIEATELFPVVSMLEYGNGGLDYAILEIAPGAGEVYPVGRLKDTVPTVGDIMTTIGHSGSLTKSVESGEFARLKSAAEGSWVEMLDMFVQGGGSGGGVVDTDGYLVTMALGTDCENPVFESGGHSLARIRSESPIIDQLLETYDVQARLGYSNNFSESLDWSNTQSFNWFLNSGPTPSGSTGPSSGDYIYFETSSSFAFNSGDQGALVSHPFDAKSKAVSFNFHMYGSNIGVLSLQYLNNGSWTTIWSRSGQQQTSSSAAWQKATVNIPSTGNTTRIRFEAVANGGYRGDIALDNVSIHPQWRTSAQILSGYSYIRSTSEQNKGADLHIQNGILEGSQAEMSWHSAQWSVKLIEGNFYKFTNRWQPNESLHTENGGVESSVAPDTWWSAQWILEPVSGKADTYRISNRWRTGQYLYLDGTAVGISSSNTSSAKFEWKFAKTF